MRSFKIYGIWPHTTFTNAVTLVWGLLRLIPISLLRRFEQRYFKNGVLLERHLNIEPVSSFQSIGVKQSCVVEPLLTSKLQSHVSCPPLLKTSPVLLFWNTGTSLKVFYVLVTQPGLSIVHCFCSQSLDTILYASVTSLVEYNKATILITNT